MRLPFRFSRKEGGEMVGEMLKGKRFIGKTGLGILGPGKILGCVY